MIIHKAHVLKIKPGLKHPENVHPELHLQETQSLWLPINSKILSIGTTYDSTAYVWTSHEKQETEQHALFTLKLFRSDETIDQTLISGMKFLATLMLTPYIGNEYHVYIPEELAL